MNQTKQTTASQNTQAQKPHSWPELIGLMFIAAIAIFVIVSIQKISVDLVAIGNNSNNQTTIQLERLQLRLESIQKMMRLGLISQDSRTLQTVQHEIKTLQPQLESLLPKKQRDQLPILTSLHEQVSTGLVSIESLLRTGVSGFTPNSAPVLKLVTSKIEGMIDSTQKSLNNTIQHQSSAMQTQSQLLRDFSDYSSLFLTIFGLFAAGLLGLALYQRQLFSNQLNANLQADEQSQKLIDTVEGFSSACALFDSNNQLQTSNRDFQQLLPNSLTAKSVRDKHTILTLLKDGHMSRHSLTTNTPYPLAPSIFHSQQEKQFELVDHKGHNLRILERPTSDGGIICTYQDISYIHQTESRLKYIDNHDKLTQLPNRTSFLKDLSQALIQAKIEAYEVAVIIYDIQNFREINDSYGHTVGDRLLQQIGTTISQSQETQIYTARIGGDQFASFISRYKSKKSVINTVNETVKHLKAGFDLDAIHIPVRLSTGLAFYPEHAETVTDLVNSADTASMHAKTTNSSLPSLFNQQLRYKTDRKRLVEQQLQNAIENNELRVQYQPQIDVRSGLTTGMEALIRWTNPKIGEVSPAEFIPLAEENGQIMELGEWVLMHSIADYKQLSQYGLSPGTMSINLSRRQFMSNNITEVLETALAKAGLTTAHLTLEITETAITDDTSQAIKIINEFKEMGIGISIDDFGVGYSSFAALREFPIDEVKIDRLFVMDVVENSSSQEIIRAIIDVAKALNAEVVAEGIENREQFEMIKSLGCHRAQGFFLCEPVEATVFPEICLGGKSIPSV